MMNESTAVDMPESSSVSKGKAPLIAAPMNEKGRIQEGSRHIRLHSKAGCYRDCSSCCRFHGNYYCPPARRWTKAAAANSGHSAAIVYLAHNGNASANWLAICQQFGDFCQKVSGSVVASFITVVILVFLVVLSALALGRH
ncbi:hypothetical protein OIU85_000616 [Salix viminalis]|uniref:CASP-like protein n=1 Tax=Salix viminalis TaxID=40686 RepID=A0A9Q0VKM6_SALVM|nr:hypothetical protein OIU85_000616 [Salix viminalis]